MARFARAAYFGSETRGRCDIKRHDRHHHCSHRNSGSCAGSCNVFVEGKPAQKVGDSVIFDSCQHSGSGKIEEGSNSIFINNKAAARVKDICTCQNPLCSRQQMIVSGASTVFFGD